MIGVIARDSEEGFVREFFELFKTPWEPWSSDDFYDVVVCTTEQNLDGVRAPLIVAYSGARLPSDPIDTTELPITDRPLHIARGTDQVPLYGRCLTFADHHSALLFEQSSGRPVARYLDAHLDNQILRIGYDLFGEVAYLLTHGQPTSQANIPTLELHIDFLRSILWSAGTTFVEVPPVPSGYQFLVCLTHDVDHPAIRNHRWDHTTAGFLYRATILSLANFLRGKSTFHSLCQNWSAMFQWPFVQLGFARDPWADFHHSYRRLEGGLPSTYFVIPYAKRPGRTLTGSAHKHRASAYGASSIEPAIQEILADGCEVSLHGLDAWLDSGSAREELKEIEDLAPATHHGVRMHWLFFDDASPRKLEQAGAIYDSTIGYRDTVGFMAGTAQAYVPPGASTLFELPLHAMDVALFFPRYMGLAQVEATPLLMSMVENIARFGGCLTLNWHDRSLSPERLWIECYQALLLELKARNVWFATCAQAAAWFHKRRAFTFTPDEAYSRSEVTVPLKLDPTIPPLILRKYEPARQSITERQIDETARANNIPMATSYTASL